MKKLLMFVLLTSLAGLLQGCLWGVPYGERRDGVRVYERTDRGRDRHDRDHRDGDRRDRDDYDRRDRDRHDRDDD